MNSKNINVDIRGIYLYCDIVIDLLSQYLSQSLLFSLITYTYQNV